MATASLKLNPNAPVYYPSPLLYPPLEVYSLYSSQQQQPLLLLPSNPSFQQQQQQQQQQPFYFEYHQTPSHTSLLYASSPPPQPFYYYHPPPQALYSCYYHLSSPHSPIPQRATIEEIEETDPDAVGDTTNKAAAEEVVRVRSNGCFGRRKFYFALKPKSRRRPSASPPQPLPPPTSHSELSQKRRMYAEFEFSSNDENGRDEGGENKTTVMIKNLPNKFT